MLYFVLCSNVLPGHLGTFAPGRPLGQVSRMREGQDGPSQRSPSLLLYIYQCRSLGRDLIPLLGLLISVALPFHPLLQIILASFSSPSPLLLLSSSSPPLLLLLLPSGGTGSGHHVYSCSLGYSRHPAKWAQSCRHLIDLSVRVHIWLQSLDCSSCPGHSASRNRYVRVH